MIFSGTHRLASAGEWAFQIVPHAAKFDEDAFLHHVVDDLHSRFVFHPPYPIIFIFYQFNNVSKAKIIQIQFLAR